MATVTYTMRERSGLHMPQRRALNIYLFHNTYIPTRWWTVGGVV